MLKENKTNLVERPNRPTSRVLPVAKWGNKQKFEIAGFHPLSASRKQAYDFYKPVALDDGFPARATPPGSGGTSDLCAYMLRDYLWTREAGEYLTPSLTALSELLPLFDVEELANTRYQLAGFSDQKLVVPNGCEISVVSGGVSFGPAIHKFSERKDVKAPTGKVTSREPQKESQPSSACLRAVQFFPWKMTCTLSAQLFGCNGASGIGLSGLQSALR